MAKPMKQAERTNQGEGNRTADRNYRDGVERHVRSGRAPKAAEDAKRALDGEEAEELRQAEEEGKQRASSLADEDDEAHVDRGRE